MKGVGWLFSHSAVSIILRITAVVTIDCTSVVYNIILYSNTPITAVALGGLGASTSAPRDHRAQKRDKERKALLLTRS